MSARLGSDAASPAATAGVARPIREGALAAGVAAGVIGVIQVTDTQSGESTVVGIEHVSLAGLSATLLLLVPLVLYLGRITDRSRAAMVAVTGQVALAALTIVSDVRGEDPSFFAAVAGEADIRRAAKSSQPTRATPALDGGGRALVGDQGMRPS